MKPQNATPQKDEEPGFTTQIKKTNGLFVKKGKGNGPLFEGTQEELTQIIQERDGQK